MNNIQIFILVGIIILFCIQYLQIQKKEIKINKNQNTDNSMKWNNQNSISIFNLFLTKWGNPTKLNVNQNGFAAWEFDNPSPWSVIMIKDVPNDFIYFSLPILVSYQFRKQILSLSPVINLTDDNLSASGDNHYQIICSLYFSMNILNKFMTLDYINKNNLLNLSIFKTQQYPFLINKYESQMIEMLLSDDTKEDISDTLDYEVDLAKYQEEEKYKEKENSYTTKYAEINKINQEEETNGFLPGIDTISKYAFL